MLVAAWLAALTFYDLRERRLPNVLTLPGAVLILTVAAGTGRGLPALAGGCALAAGYLLVHLVSPAGMGAGDVKLAIGVGALAGVFGAGAWLLAALGAPVLTAVWGVAARRRVLPHGPSMCLSTAAALTLAISAR